MLQLCMTILQSLFATATDAPAVAGSWLRALEAACHDADVEAVEALMLPLGWWRDLLCFSWDFRSLAGRAALNKFLSEDSRLATAGLHSFATDATTDFGAPFLYPVPGAPPTVQGIQFSFTFKLTSPPATGKGLVRLMQDQADGQWKAFTAFTSLADIVGHEERVGPAELSHVQTWEQACLARRALIEADPTVLIVGGAQNGLITAARLGQMGINALVLEREARVGDIWRRRYPTLMLHTHSNICSFLYESYPVNFPRYMPKDKLADALEAYVKTQDLHVWTSSSVLGDPEPIYDSSTSSWTVHVSHGGETKILHPKHIVMATGFAGSPRMVKWPGQENFQGAVYHSSAHPGGHAFTSNQRVVVIGAGQSAADMCQDMLRSGAQRITMVQRSATCVMSRSLVEKNVYSLWPYNRSIADSDFAVNAMPQGLLCMLAAAGGTAMDKMADLAMHDGLRDAGFNLTWGQELGMGEIGMFGILLHRFGGYWLDIGCAGAIADGRIGLKQGVEVESFDKTGVVFEDGSRLDADVVILATGYQSVRETARGIFGSKVIDQTTEVWGLDAEGETRGMYRPSGHPALWYAVGGFNHARFYSKHLALQIQARELGII